MTQSQVSAQTFNFTYTLPSPGRVSLNVYDADGRVVRELLHATPRTAGTHAVTWDGKDAQGVDVPSAASCTWKLLLTPGAL